jgi:hypothetical protein
MSIAAGLVALRPMVIRIALLGFAVAVLAAR